MTEEKKSFDDLDAVKMVVEALEKFNDSEKERIIRWACEKMGTATNLARPVSEKNIDKEKVVNNDIEIKQRNSVKDIKSFVSEKNPVNDVQFVTVVAYYYKFEAPEDESKEFIDGKDLQEAARLVNWKRFVKATATLHNVHSKSGFLDKVEHGKYKLNTVGENLVAMVLPSDEKKAPQEIKKQRQKIKR